MRSSHKEKWYSINSLLVVWAFFGGKHGPPQGSFDILTMDLIKRASALILWLLILWQPGDSGGHLKRQNRVMSVL